MIKKIYIYIADSVNPHENLAKEEYLFNILPKDSSILYLWQNANTVVIGKNQNPYTECNLEHLKEDGVKLARRSSGGGAVFHDLGNLNFTFIAGREDYSVERNMEVIKLACSMAGINAELSGRNDILADGRKFSGNAFYNSAGKAFQHGTLMLFADTSKMQKYLTPPKAKLEAKGVKSVRSRVVNLTELCPSLTCDKMREYMIDAFEKTYNMKAEYIDISDVEEVKALTQKYGDNSFLYGETPPFTVFYEDYFPWGSIRLELNVVKGNIQTATVYTDSLETELPQMIKKALEGQSFEDEAIKKGFSENLPEPFLSDILKMHRA